MSLNSRVCDRCIKKKVKCDLQRPSCSRCSETDSPCIYSKERRKPGPQRGARRLASSARLSSTNVPTHEASQDDSPVRDSLLVNPLLDGGTTSQQFMPDLRELSTNFSPVMIPTANQSRFPGYYLNPSQERDILLQFFEDVHSAIPLFQRDKFLRSYDEGASFCDLVVTMVTVTTKILGPTDCWRSEDVDLCMNSLLAATAYENDSSSSQTGLDQFRQECLLAYYDFHQFPGPPAWMRISRLARRAYSMGLNQIEIPSLCSAYDAGLATEDEIENWRYVWWCVYCLDSYSNISLGAPFIIDLESINTALVRRPYTDEEVPDLPKLFLPDDEDQLWRTAQDVVSSLCEKEFNIHIITTTILRQAGKILRLRATRKPVHSKVAALRSSLAALRLALPPRYLNPSRNVLIAESEAHHHIRLTNLLHLHMSRLIVALPQDFKANEGEWLYGWQQSLETCQDIVLIIEQWNNQFSSRVDPAICLIAFVALWVTNLQRRCLMDATGLLSDGLVRAESILLLFLEQFSRMWALPSILIQLFNGLSTQDLLTYADVDRMINGLKMPLHPKTLHRAYAMSFSSTDLFGGFDIATDLADIWPFSTENLNI
ncbi:hypothetical protein F4677DRAFT_457932 [Hypoxylon crocopeplum]|nr:hypothetical protein F4677DRAFT_457932 [Hypoxylon crocopeplum]